MEVLRSGVDSLDVAFKGRLPVKVLKALRQAKEQAASNGSPALIQIGDVAGHVAETGVKGGGYAFRFDTGPDGEIWMIKDNSDPDQWNLFVSVRAANLAIEGFEGAVSGLWKRLEGFGAKVIEESVNRVDFAVDVVADDFILDPALIVCHSHCRVAEHSEQEEPEAFSVMRASRRVQTVTVGKMPGRQVQIYDKRREVMYQREKRFWLDVWGYEQDDCPAIWRVEIRAGKRHLTDWGLTTFDDLRKSHGDIVTAAMESVRLLAERPEPNVNVTRAEVHDLWGVVSGEVVNALGAAVSGITRARVRERLRGELIENLRAQIVGCATTYAVAMGKDVKAAVSEIPDVLIGDWDAATASVGDFLKRFKKSADRYHFLDEKDDVEDADLFDPVAEVPLR